MSLFNKCRTGENQQEYEAYMAGFRQGYPVEGDEETTIIDDADPEFLRGMADGERGFQENRVLRAKRNAE